MKSCTWCETRQKLGWYGNPKIHHCRDCHRTWTGTTQVHCVRCHHHFSSHSACDRHLDNEMCKPPQECRSRSGLPLLGLRADKFGYTWSFAGDGTPWWLAKHVRTDETPEAITPRASLPDLSSVTVDEQHTELEEPIEQ